MKIEKDPYYNICEAVKYWSCHTIEGYLLGNGNIRVTRVIDDYIDKKEKRGNRK